MGGEVERGEAGRGEVVGGASGKGFQRRHYGCLVSMAAAFAIVLGILFFVANALADIDRGTYCESGDHPGKCSDPREFTIPGSILIVLGGVGIWWGVRLRKPTDQ